MTEAAGLAGRGINPAARIEAAFADIARTRMARWPLLNPALTVEAVDFGLWQDYWLGVLITPWCLNLMLLPAREDDRRPLAPGDKRRVEFPAGVFEFIGGRAPRIGTYASCSLFSPVLEFADQAAARLTARAARGALFYLRDVGRLEEHETSTGGPMRLPRRSFLRGAVTGGK